MPQQMPIWKYENDALSLDTVKRSRIPDYFYNHYCIAKECFHCRQSLRHELHAYNHFMRYHALRMEHRYYYWNKYDQSWVLINQHLYQIYKIYRLPVAVARY